MPDRPRRPGGRPPPLAGGRYLLEAPIGAGAGGEVFAARDTLLDRSVAIKRLPPGLLAAVSGGGDTTGRTDTAEFEEATARLLAEARALARLSHPNVVPVHDAFETGGRLHVVMEWVQGPS